jgi:hypothetical protein
MQPSAHREAAPSADGDWQPVETEAEAIAFQTKARSFLPLEDFLERCPCERNRQSRALNFSVTMSCSE